MKTKNGLKNTNLHHPSINSIKLNTKYSNGTNGHFLHRNVLPHLSHHFFAVMIVNVAKTCKRIADGHCFPNLTMNQMNRFGHSLNGEKSVSFYSPLDGWENNTTV